VTALQAAAGGTHAEIASHITKVLNAHLNDAAPAPADYDDPRFFGNQVAVWAFGYQITGNAQYAAKARQQLFTYLGWSDWSFGETANAGGPDLNAGHMLIGVAAAYDWIYPYLSDADRHQIAARLGAEADKMAVYLPNAWYVDEYVQNHNWINSAGLGLAALALQGEDVRAAAWLTLAQGNLQKLAIALGAIADGTFHEGLGYQGYGVSMSLPFWTALAQSGADYTDLGLLRGFGKYLLYSGIPDAPRQTILSFGDFTGWPNQQIVEIARYTAARFHDTLAAAAAKRWLDAGGRGTFLPELFYDVFEFLYYDPTIPLADPHAQPLDAAFPDLGAAVLHSSWDAGDLVVGFKAGVYGGRANFDRVKAAVAPGGWICWGHDHNDDLSFWLYGRGAWLAPEALGYDASNNTSATYKANQTAYHNALLVDGQGQLGDVRVSDTNWNNPWFFNRNDGVLVSPIGTADYAIAGGRGAALFDASLGISRWDRLLVLARKRYLLVHDDIQATAAHTFDWISHFSDGATVDTASGWVQGVGKSGQSLGVRVLSPAAWTATTGSQTAALMNLADPDGQTAWVRVRPAAAAAQAQFLMALMPVATTSWAQRTRVDALDSNDVGAGAVVAPGSLLEERWIFSRAGAEAKVAGDLSLTGSLAGVAARNGAGAHVRAALFGAGRIFDQSGARELLSSTSARAIEADQQGSILAVTGDGVADFHAYAPSAASVMLNGTAVAANFESGMVIYPRTVPPPPDAGTPSTDGGSSPDAGDLDAGNPDAGGTAPDGGNAIGTPRQVDAGAPEIAAATVVAGCSTGASSGWIALAAVLLLACIRRRR
jgi:hypothetical protein